jgi:hypothetical protein
MQNKDLTEKWARIRVLQKNMYPSQDNVAMRNHMVEMEYY